MTWTKSARAARGSYAVFPFLLRLVGAVRPSIRVLIQIEREIGLVHAYAIRRR